MEATVKKRVGAFSVQLLFLVPNYISNPIYKYLVLGTVTCLIAICMGTSTPSLFREISAPYNHAGPRRTVAGTGRTVAGKTWIL
jgi:hypothetical protein